MGAVQGVGGWVFMEAHVIPVGHLAVNCGRSEGRVGYLAEGDLLLAPEVPRHLAAGPLYDLGVGQVSRRSGVR